MAGIYYRSQASGNWSAPATWYQYNSPTNWIAATDYPKTGDYVWIQSTHVVTYDATAISTNNGATFAQISNRIDANGSAIAQPTPSTGGVGALNATTGYIALSVASPTTIASTYYSVLSSSNSLFNITASSTFTFSGAFFRGTTGGFIRADTGSAGSTLNFTGNPIGGTGVSGQCIFLNAAITTNIIGTSLKGGDGATSYGIYIGAGTQTINITSTDVNGSDSSTTGYAIASANTNQHSITIVGNVNSGVTVGAINCASAILTANTGAIVEVTGNIRNYGIGATNNYAAIQSAILKLNSNNDLLYATTDAGLKTFLVGTTPPLSKYVLENTGDNTGTLTLPQPANVLSGVNYGVGQAVSPAEQSTGTLDIPNAVAQVVGNIVANLT